MSRITANNKKKDELILNNKYVDLEQGLKTNNVVHILDESIGLPVGVPKKKSCALCKGIGHHNKYECSNFKIKYGITPMKKNDRKAWGEI